MCLNFLQHLFNNQSEVEVEVEPEVDKCTPLLSSLNNNYNYNYSSEYLNRMLDPTTCKLCERMNTKTSNQYMFCPDCKKKYGL